MLEDFATKLNVTMSQKTFRCKSFTRLVFRSFAAVTVVFLLISSGNQVYSQIQSPPASSDGSSNYRISIGDVLKIIVLKQDILSQDGIRVSNEGTIRLPMIDNPITATCLTEAELSAVITESYKKYLLNPQVYVSVKEFKGNPVAVVGAVNSPGTFQIQRPMRLLELLTYVNGPAQNAGESIQIVRNPETVRCGQAGIETLGSSQSDETSQEEIISLSLPEVMKGNRNSNPLVLAGDIVRVSEAKVKQAFVIGSVKSAVTVPLKEPVTLSRAIAMAGGAASGAKTDKIKISRQDPVTLAKADIIVNLKDVSKPGENDILLQPNDVIDVPGPSATRKWLKTLLGSVTTVFTRVPVVIP